MDTVQMLNLILAVVVLLIFILGAVALIIVLKISKKKQEDKPETDQTKQKTSANLITRDGKEIDSIYKFMEFDRINDNMIVRKNNKQFVMVIECKGINYDLLSEDEKNAIELGFIELLNTLRFPIQLYVQTRTLNLNDIIKEYTKRTDDIRDQINRLNSQIQLASSRREYEVVKKLQFDRRRKENILEYGESIEDYTIRISESKNILQQKTYIVVSYYTSEYGDISKYSKDEITDIAFSELYTRCQSIIRALTSAEVVGTVLSSEELAELLYVAYNRDESEKYTLKNALDSEYDRLYSTSRDVLEEKKKRINARIDDDASKVAAKSILKADQITREERARRVRERAKQMVDEYKNDLSKSVYEESKRQIDNTSEDELISEEKQEGIRGMSDENKQNNEQNTNGNQTKRRIVRRKTN